MLASRKLVLTMTFSVDAFWDGGPAHRGPSPLFLGTMEAKIVGSDFHLAQRDLIHGALELALSGSL